MVAVAVWNQIPYNFIFFLSGLQGIPASIREAAAIDCKSGTRRFWTVILPLLTPTAFFLLIINMTYSLFDTFGVIDVIVKDKAANNPITLVYKVYLDGFRGNDLGCVLGPVGDPDGGRSGADARSSSASSNAAFTTVEVEPCTAPSSSTISS